MNDKTDINNEENLLCLESIILLLLLYNIYVV